MKKCIYCGTILEDDVEKCCEFSDFEYIEEEKVIDEEKTECPKDEQEFEEIVQPAAHELLVELVELINLDDVNEEIKYPEWINEIPYEEVHKIAIAKYQDDNPDLVTRIKKYLGL